jgi:hypothetical protein
VIVPENVTSPVQILVDDVVRGTAGTDGVFALDNVAVGARRLSFRSQAIAVRDVSVNVQEGQSNLLLVTLRTAPLVVVRRNPAVADSRMSEFRRRQQAGGGGYFITRPEIEKRNPRSFTDLMRSVPGVRVIGYGGGFRYVSSHFRRLPSGVTDGNCDLMMYVDGQPFPIDNGDADARISITEIGAMEVYVSASSVPRQFAGATAACGVIVIWRGR